MFHYHATLIRRDADKFWNCAPWDIKKENFHYDELSTKTSKKRSINQFINQKEFDANNRPQA